MFEWLFKNRKKKMGDLEIEDLLAYQNQMEIHSTKQKVRDGKDSTAVADDEDLDYII